MSKENRQGVKMITNCIDLRPVCYHLVVVQMHAAPC